MEWMLMPLKRYAEFSGRSRRMEYWMFVLFQVLLFVVFGIIAGVLVGGAASMGAGSTSGGVSGGVVGMVASLGVLGLVFAIVWLGLLIPAIAVAVRRLHDTSRSGFWLFLYIAPYILGYIVLTVGAASQSSGLVMVGGLISLLGFIGAIVLLVFFCLPGTVGPNKYGPDPLAVERGAVGVPGTY